MMAQILGDTTMLFSNGDYLPPPSPSRTPHTQICSLSQSDVITVHLDNHGNDRITLQKKWVIGQSDQVESDITEPKNQNVWQALPDSLLNLLNILFTAQLKNLILKYPGISINMKTILACLKWNTNQFCTEYCTVKNATVSDDHPPPHTESNVDSL